MKKLRKFMLISGLAIASLCQFAAWAEEAPSPFSGKVTLISEYEYRGIGQTAEKPALQLNLDYSHSSGLYAGTFLSNISWLKDTADVSGFKSNANLEWDLFAGYKYKLADTVVDLGYLRYEYPSSSEFKTNPYSPYVSPNTDEIYAGLTYRAFNFKYSHSTSTLFGVPGSKGSGFYEVNFSSEIMPKLTLALHVGHQKYAGAQRLGNNTLFNNSNFDYTVWRAGLTYDLHGWLLSAYAKGTDADSTYFTLKDKDQSRDRFVVSVARPF